MRQEPKSCVLVFSCLFNMGATYTVYLFNLPKMLTWIMVYVKLVQECGLDFDIVNC